MRDQATEITFILLTDFANHEQLAISNVIAFHKCDAGVTTHALADNILTKLN